MIPFHCPNNTTIELVKSESSYVCRDCNRTYPIVNGIPEFTTKSFYWGEISEEEMDSIIDVIRREGYRAALKYIALHNPGRIRFILDPTRADWSWMTTMREGMKVLDLGCGWGSHSFPLAARGAEVYAVDATPQRVEFVKARATSEHVQNVHVLRGDVMQLPFKPGTFDLIVSNGVLEWVGLDERDPDPMAVQLEFLRKMKALLKPGGTLYVGIENRFAFTYFRNGVDHSGLRYTSLMPRSMANAFTRFRTGKAYRTYTYSYAGYEKLFNEAGLAIADSYIPMPGYNYPSTIIPYSGTSELAYYVRSRQRIARTGSLMRFVSRSRFFNSIVRRGVFSYLFFLS